MVMYWVSKEVIYSTLTGLSTVLGTLLVMRFTLKEKMIAFSLGISSGVMLFVSYFTLLPTALQFGDMTYVSIGIVCSILFMLLLHAYPFSKVKEADETSRYTRLGIMLVIAIIAHNLPEGAAIGIGFHAEHHVGILLALALAIHNVPEGIGLAVPLVAAGKKPSLILLVSLLCAVVMPIGTWIGTHFLVQSPAFVSASLTFAAAVMIWIVICEISPRAFTLHRAAAVTGMIFGGCFMYIIHHLH